MLARRNNARKIPESPESKESNVLLLRKTTPHTEESASIRLRS